MGTFDHINYKMDCPSCGKEVSGFQSKDGGCDFELLDYWEVDNFYTSCDYCDTWIEFYREKKKPYVPIDDYSIRTRDSELDESQRLRNSDGKIYGYTGKSDIDKPRTDG